MSIINLLIYVLACFGLVFTMVSICERYSIDTDYVELININKTSENNNKDKIIIYLKETEDLNKIISLIENGKYDNIYEFASDVKLMKYN